jgi:hypothetical protein
VLLHGLEPHEARRRYLALGDDAEREILKWIETQAAKSRAATPRHIRKHIGTCYNALRTRATEKHGVRFDIDFILKSRAKPYVNAEMFAGHIRTVPIPNLNKLRTLGEFAQEEVILLMDNCPSHAAEPVFAVSGDARVRVII